MLEEQDEALDLLESRRSIYAFLARVFEKEVTVDFLEQCTLEDSPLLQMVKPEILKEEDKEDEELADGFRELTDYLREKSNKDFTETKLELDIEYANLFLGIIGKPPHPSESVYSTEDHLLMQRARDEVMFAYRAAGVDKVQEFREPEDHIAIELQFMAYLCGKTEDASRAKDAAAFEKYLNFQKDFIKKHLGKWVPDLTRDLLDSGKIGFYRGTAKILNGFVKTDMQNIDLLQKSVSAA